MAEVENSNPNLSTNQKMKQEENGKVEQLYRQTCLVQVNDQFKTQSSALSANAHLQYSEIYGARISKLGPLVRDNCLLKWPNEKECSRIAGLSLLVDGNSNDLISATSATTAKAAITSSIAWVVGTVYVDIPLKENILNEITREQWVDAPKLKQKYISDADKVILEDESGRVVLSGNILSRFLVCTGMIIGVLGRQLDDGTFHVLDICFPLLAPQSPISKDQEESWVAFVSGLEIGADDSLDFKLQLLSDWITGELGDEETQEAISRISRLVIVGNALCSQSPENQKSVKNKFGRMVVQFDPQPLENLDEFLSGLVSGIDVDLMPGANDPTTHLVPQRPIHPSLLQKSHGYSTLHSVTNPYLASMGDKNGTEMLCTSGQVVDDIFKFVSTQDRLGIATAVIGCGTVSPTSPDTLWTSPSNQDSFILEKIPHLFVVGNQPEYKTRMLVTPRGRIGEAWNNGENGREEGDDSSPISIDTPGEGEDQDVCRVVLVPKFHETGGVVLVRLDTLETKIIYFKQAARAANNVDSL